MSSRRSAATAIFQSLCQPASEPATRTLLTLLKSKMPKVDISGNDRDPATIFNDIFVERS